MYNRSAIIRRLCAVEVTRRSSPAPFGDGYLPLVALSAIVCFHGVTCRQASTEVAVTKRDRERPLGDGSRSFGVREVSDRVHPQNDVLNCAVRSSRGTRSA